MRELILPVLLIALVLLVIAAFKSNGAVEHPLLVDSAFEESTKPASPPWRLYTRCPVNERNIPILDDREA
jgi:hypothetical protein